MEWPDVAPEPTRRTTERESATESEVEARLAAIEELLVAMARRIDGLESTVRTAVAQEVGAVSEDLRHTVSELGRLFVRDVGRLARVLDHHREEIIAELRPPPARAPEPPSDRRPTDPGEAADRGEDLDDDDLDDDLDDGDLDDGMARGGGRPGGAAGAGGATGAARGDERRRRRLRRRA